MFSEESWCLVSISRERNARLPPPLKSISQITLCQFATALFNCGQLQTVLVKDGLYRKAPLKF